ncbi:MAG: flagellar basal body-associated FliL family protein [Granulosicoccaceae bacterium]
MRKSIARGLVLAFSLLFASASYAEGEEDGGNSGDPLFVSMVPHFTVNLGAARFLNMTAETLVGDPDTKTALEKNMPAIRHAILMMLADMVPEDLSTSRQKEVMRRDITRAMRKTLKDLGADDDVRGFYITSLVIQ